MKKAKGLLLQLGQSEGESCDEFTEGIRDLARQGTSPGGVTVEPCSSLFVNVLSQGGRDRYAALQALSVNHRSLEHAVAFVTLYCSHEDIVFLRSKVPSRFNEARECLNDHDSSTSTSTPLRRIKVCDYMKVRDNQSSG